MDAFHISSPSNPMSVTHFFRYLICIFLILSFILEKKSEVSIIEKAIFTLPAKQDATTAKPMCKGQLGHVYARV